MLRVQWPTDSSNFTRALILTGFYHWLRVSRSEKEKRNSMSKFHVLYKRGKKTCICIHIGKWVVLRKRKRWSKNVYLADLMKKIYLNGEKEWEREVRQRDVVTFLFQSIRVRERENEHLCMPGHGKE
jgi:hypothetical protein